MITNEMIVREVVMNYFRIVDARQFDELPMIFHPNVSYERPGYEPLIGIDSVINFYKNVRVLVSGQHEVKGLIINGDNCACWGRFIGKKKGDIPVDERFVDILSFEDGLIKNRVTYFYKESV